MFTWHCAQATVVWPPVSGNGVLLWLNVAGCQAVFVWHVVQSVTNPVCGGALAVVKSVWWHPMHVVAVVAQFVVLVWH